MGVGVGVAVAMGVFVTGGLNGGCCVGRGSTMEAGLARQAGRLDEQPESQGAADEEGEEGAAEHGAGRQSAGRVKALGAEVSAVIGTVRLTTTRATFGGLIIAGVAAHHLI